MRRFLLLSSASSHNQQCTWRRTIGGVRFFTHIPRHEGLSCVGVIEMYSRKKKKCRGSSGATIMAVRGWYASVNRGRHFLSRWLRGCWSYITRQEATDESVTCRALIKCYV